MIFIKYICESQCATAVLQLAQWEQDNVWNNTRKKFFNSYRTNHTFMVCLSTHDLGQSQNDIITDLDVPSQGVPLLSMW